MSKSIQLFCTQKMCALLADILRQYADAAYPRGGSECAQSARETLLMSVEQMLAAWDATSHSSLISKRLRVPVKSAIEYHAQRLEEEEGLPANHRAAYLLGVLKGEVIDEDGYHAAQQQDRFA